MEIEYSNEVKGRVFAYRFTSNEKVAIAAGLGPYVKQLEKKILKIENNPKNEGQANFACQIDELESEKRDIQFIIKEFANG